VIRLLLVALFLAASPVVADDALNARLKSLETQLRCLVCQNQTLAESEAPLAEDLRKEVRELAVSGKSDDDIRAYLVARYGDFVLYKPPVKPVTYLLWFGPFLLLVAGLGVWLLTLRRRARMKRREAGDTTRLANDEPGVDIAHARALLDE
jgi:cytochrome c-type biogenesis protein CcmH